MRFPILCTEALNMPSIKVFIIQHTTRLSSGATFLAQVIVLGCSRVLLPFVEVFWSRLSRLIICPSLHSPNRTTRATIILPHSSRKTLRSTHAFSDRLMNGGYAQNRQKALSESMKCTLLIAKCYWPAGDNFCGKLVNTPRTSTVISKSRFIKVCGKLTNLPPKSTVKSRGKSTRLP
jgi:hypothetical protein